jgi:hypothetical protein
MHLFQHVASISREPARHNAERQADVVSNALTASSSRSLPFLAAASAHLRQIPHPVDDSQHVLDTEHRTLTCFVPFPWFISRRSPAGGLSECDVV